MPYFVTENFAAGIDTRKHPITAPPGTLRQLTNAHLTPGGEIEKRFAFVRAHLSDLAGDGVNPVPMLRGLARVGNTSWLITPHTGGQQVQYGDLTIRYLNLPGTAADYAVLDWDVFNGRLYVVTEDTGGVVQHWYQDVDDTDPDNIILLDTATEVAGGKGKYIRTYQEKMYSCSGSDIFFSIIGDPTIWENDPDYEDPPGTPAPRVGAGYINASSFDAEALDLTGIEVYYDRLAFFSARTIQLWSMDADPANNVQSQHVRSIGVAARATPRQYGPGDILFVAPSGVRSLQARDSSNSASVSDVGSPIDADIVFKIRNDTENFVENAQSMLEDLTGRFWVMFSDEMWVLSLFPGPRVSAWSRYLPTFEDVDEAQKPFVPETLVDAAGYVCVLGEDNWLYVLGGDTRSVYDNVQCEIITPFISLDRPATWKQFLGFDAAADGQWDVEMALTPANGAVYEPVGRLDGASYNDQTLAFRGHSPYVSMRFLSTDDGYCRMANYAIHYNLSDDD